MFVFVDIKEENLAKPFLTLFGLEDSEDTLVSFIMNNFNTNLTFFFSKLFQDFANDIMIFFLFLFF